MGKGFLAAEGIAGQDVTDLIMSACRRRVSSSLHDKQATYGWQHLDVQLYAIINDGSATLLSRAYVDPSTCFGLVLGTGTNVSVMLPVSALAKSKYGQRPELWLDCAKEVLVNTEYSMFGRNVLPNTRWDYELNAGHVLPDFQPYEHMIGGRYLGEIVRLILLEAIQNHNLFDKYIPKSLREPYSLDTAILAAIEADTSPQLVGGKTAFTDNHDLPVPLSTKDMHYLRTIIRLVTHRAAVLLAVAIHALWMLRIATIKESPSTTHRVTIGCNGSVIEKYPGFIATTQAYLDKLTTKSEAVGRAVELQTAMDSTIYGAAVAVASLQKQE